jgi:hypothetical protein
MTCGADGQFMPATCPFTCRDGACAGSCVPGTSRCSGTPGGNILETCDSDGAYTNIRVCNFACKRGACVGVCHPGDKRCTGSVPQICDTSGEWAFNGFCPTGCVDAGVCNPVD